MRPVTTVLLSTVFVFTITSSSSAYYRYETGRWLNQDPTGYQDSINLYAYVGSNPINNYDSYGLQMYVDPRLYECEFPDDCDYDERRSELYEECIQWCIHTYINFPQKQDACIRSCDIKYPEDPWDAPLSLLELWEEHAVWDEDKRCIKELHFYGHGVEPPVPDMFVLVSTFDTSDTYSIRGDRVFEDEDPIMQADDDLCCGAILYIHGCYIGNNTEFMRLVGERSSKIKQVCSWTGNLPYIEIWGKVWWISDPEGEFVCVDVNEEEHCKNF